MNLLNIPSIGIIYIVITLLFLMLSSITIVLILIYQKRRQQHMIEMATLKQTYEQTLLQSQIEVQEATLSTLSQELHDNVGQLLSTAKMLLGITERNITNPPDTLITANETVGKAITEVRSLSKSLSKEWLEQFDLIKNLEAEVERVNSAKTMKIDLEHSGKLTLKTDEQIILFRIIQEAIQNAIKHSGANNICISIFLEDRLLVTNIKDNGKGFAQNQAIDGVGIINMKHRTKLLGGTIEWQSSNEGSNVIITLPVKDTGQ